MIQMKKPNRKSLPIPELSKRMGSLQSAICKLDDRGDNEVVTLAMILVSLAREAAEKGNLLSADQLYAEGRACFKKEHGHEYVG